MIGRKIINRVRAIGSKVLAVVRSPGAKAVVDYFAKQPLLNEFSTSAKAFLEKYGSRLVTKLWACRTPLSGMAHALIRLTAGPRWNEEAKRLNIDTYFHTYLRGELDDGTLFELEKNARPEFRLSSGPRSGEESVSISIQKQKSLGQLVSDALKSVGENRYFVYRAYVNNCQRFVLDNIEQFHPSPEVRSFVKQDLESLVETLPQFKKEAINAVTNTASRIETGLNL